MEKILHINVKCIDGEELERWLTNTIKHLFPDDHTFFIIPCHFDDYKNGHRFISVVNLNKINSMPFTFEEFLTFESDVVAGSKVHYWDASLVAQFAMKNNMLREGYYHIFYNP